MALFAGLVLGAGSCASDKADLSGVWSPDDGTPSKTFQQDGACTGMYYNQGEPLDIGGGMTCVLADEPDSDGRYQLVVSQPPNQQTLAVEFAGPDTVVIYDAEGTRVVGMERP